MLSHIFGSKAQSKEMVKKARRTWCRHQTRVGEQQNIKYSDLLKEAAVGETWPESKTKIRAKPLIPRARWEEYICKSLQALRLHPQMASNNLNKALLLMISTFSCQKTAVCIASVGAHEPSVYYIRPR
jgi:hypothetical protein